MSSDHITENTTRVFSSMYPPKFIHIYLLSSSIILLIPPSISQVSAMDLLCSGVGELCGGSLREERLDVQERLLAQRHIDTEQLQW